MRIVEMVQGSPEWFAIRATLPTASEAARLLTNTGKPSSQADTYANELIAARLTGSSGGFEGNQWTDRGNALEGEARAYYEFVTGNSVQEVGFCVSDCGRAGCSPDGLVGEDGGIELKCPKGSTHIGYLLKDVVPTDYIAQIQCSLFVTGREWWDFMSYCPGADPLLKRVLPDPEWHAKFSEALDSFHALLASKWHRLEELGYAHP